MDRNSKKAWLYLLPALVLLGLFLIYPLVDVLIYSVEECYNFASQTYQGLACTTTPTCSTTPISSRRWRTPLCW